MDAINMCRQLIGRTLASLGVYEIETLEFSQLHLHNNSICLRFYKFTHSHTHTHSCSINSHKLNISRVVQTRAVHTLINVKSINLLSNRLLPTFLSV